MKTGTQGTGIGFFYCFPEKRGAKRHLCQHALYRQALNGCGVSDSPNNDIDADSTINVLSHEQMEAVTDPLLNAWYDVLGNEIGDKCAWNFGTINLDANLANAQLHNNFYLVQQERSNADSGCVIWFAPPPPTNALFIGSAGSNGYVYALNAGNGAPAQVARPRARRCLYTARA